LLEFGQKKTFSKYHLLKMNFKKAGKTKSKGLSVVLNLINLVATISRANFAAT
jgi:hypothetical protein